MQQSGGFFLSCKNRKVATAVAETAKRCLLDLNLSDSFWYMYMKASGSSVQVDTSVFIEWEEFDGLFSKICYYVESELPGAILSGSANYSGPGFSVCIKAERSKSGLSVYADGETSDDSMHVCMACGGEFPEDECVYVDHCDGLFCNDCYENSF